MDLTGQIARALAAYTDEVVEKIEECIIEVAKETVIELKNTSPERSGKYAKKWRFKKVGNKQVVYNAVAHLTHLTEFGHAKVNGGRIEGIPHILPAQQNAISKLNERVARVLEGIR